MGKFYSVPGMRPYGGEGNMGGSREIVDLSQPNSAISDLVHDWYGEAAEANPRVQEFLKARGETSHESISEPGQKFNYREEGVGGEILHEEKDSHTGKIEQIVRVSSETDSGTRKFTWEPAGPRTMVQTDDRRAD